MINRVTNRRGDASDADAEIVRKQIEAGGDLPHGWTIVETDGAAETTALRVAASIGTRV
jgi:hypothetical protein